MLRVLRGAKLEDPHLSLSLSLSLSRWGGGGSDAKSEKRRVVSRRRRSVSELSESMAAWRLKPQVHDQLLTFGPPLVILGVVCGAYLLFHFNYIK